MHQLIIFYDSRCPLCCYEMDKLLQHDKDSLITLVDIYSKEFNELAPGITTGNALAKIHGIHQGTLIQGIDVNYWAWTLVGKKHWVILLKVPVFRQFAKLAYHFFARFRQPISALFSKIFKLQTKQCSTGYCHVKKTFDHRSK